MSHELIYLPVDAHERSLVRWYRASRHYGNVDRLLSLMAVLEPYVEAGADVAKLLSLGTARREELQLEQRLTQLTLEVAASREEASSLSKRVADLETARLPSPGGRVEESGDRSGVLSPTPISPQTPSGGPQLASQNVGSEQPATQTGLRYVGELSARAMSTEANSAPQRADGEKTGPRPGPPNGRVEPTEKKPESPNAVAATGQEVVQGVDEADHNEEDESAGTVRLEIEVLGERISGRNVPTFYTQLAGFLARRKLIPEGFLPFGTGSKRFIASKQPVHPNGRAFFSPVGGDGLYLEAHCSRARGLEAAVELIEALGLRKLNDKSNHGVQLSTPTPLPRVRVRSGARSNEALQIRHKRLRARGRLTRDGFLVLKDSEAALTDQPSLSNTSAGLATLRKRLVEQKILVVSGDHYVFARDYEFDSPSAAGLAVCGYPVSGKLMWVNQEGVPLRDLE